MQIYSHVFETWQKGLKKSVYLKKLTGSLLQSTSSYFDSKKREPNVEYETQLYSLLLQPKKLTLGNCQYNGLG